MLIPRSLVGLSVLVATVAIPSNLATAQVESGCSLPERAVFSDARPLQLTVARDGATMMTLQFPAGTLVGACFEQRGAQGEMIGDVTIRATRGDRTDAAVRQAVINGGAPIAVSLTDVEVTR